MSITRKLRKPRRTTVLSKREPPVLIVRPYKQDHRTYEETSQFCAKALARGIADILPRPSHTAHTVRNQGILTFLKSPQHAKKTHIFMLDDDSTPCDDMVLEKLLQFSRRHNRAVVAGVTPIAMVQHGLNYNKLDWLEAGYVHDQAIKLDLHWSAQAIGKDGKAEVLGIDELPRTPFKAARVGGTCLLVRRDALLKIRQPFQRWTYDETETKPILSEDLYFSQKLRQAGFDLWVHPEAVCHHFHTFDILDVFAVATISRERGRRDG